MLSSPPHPNPEERSRDEELTDLRVLRDALPSAVALSLLLDRRVRVSRDGGVVTVSEGGHVWLVLAVDQPHGTHRLGRLEISAAASQRPGGPVSIGTSKSQWLLDVGERAIVGDYVVSVIARGTGVTYAIVDRVFWRGVL